MAEPYVPIATYTTYSNLETVLDTAVSSTKVYTDSVASSLTSSANSVSIAKTAETSVLSNNIFFLAGG
jgi:hypothetical protein